VLGTIGRVPVTIGRVPACSAKSLGVLLSLLMAHRVPGWPIDSFPGINSRQCEAVSVFNPQDSEVPLSPGRLQRSGDGSNLVSTLCSY
jgi:hypothetical protein